MMSAIGGFCCKSLFAPPIKNFPGYRRGDRMLMWGTTASRDELTRDFGGTSEATSIGDRSLFHPFAENQSLGIFRRDRGDYTRVHYKHTAHETAGAPGARHSLRPLISEGATLTAKLAWMRRDRETVSRERVSTQHLAV
jgi:hypothetical protein